jgi:hypothetical protein
MIGVLISRGKIGRAKWLMPVILATQAVEIGRIMVWFEVSWGGKVCVTDSILTNKSWAWWCVPVISATWEA